MTPIIELDHVTRRFGTGAGSVVAVDDVTIGVAPGDVLALVGESGCGKTTTGRLMTGLLAPSAGVIRFRGADVAALRGEERRAYRLGVQLVHQDPYASLNPTSRIFDILTTPLRRHRLARGESAVRGRAERLLRMVDLAPDEILGKFAHQLSGGQRQRVAIARALTVEPLLLVADEAVSMVDVSIRLSLLDALRRLRDEMGLAVLFISHDLALARHFATDGQISVMYLGRIVETGGAGRVIGDPQHPYTRALLAAVPPDPLLATRGSRAPIELRSNEVPSLADLPAGCSFHPRCPRFEPGVCDEVVPALTRLPDGVRVACHPVARAALLADAADRPEVDLRPRPVALGLDTGQRNEAPPSRSERKEVVRD